VPINVYETQEDIVIVAAMPGVEADNIDVEAEGSTITLTSAVRGPGQSDRSYLLQEWTYGPYTRTITLPMEIDPQHANASHGNGVLVVSIPKGERSRVVKVPLRGSKAAAEPESGHSGHHTSREGLVEKA